MEVKYAPNIRQQIEQAIHDAEEQGQEIEAIYLTPEEMAVLSRLMIADLQGEVDEDLSQYALAEIEINGVPVVIKPDWADNPVQGVH